jgi:tetratricopeptide (TPR) repeat protein
MRFLAAGVVCLVSSLYISSCNQVGKSELMPVTTDSELAFEYFQTGMTAFDRVKLEMAKFHFENAIREDPDFFMAHFWMYFISSKSAKKIAEQALKSDAPLSEGEKYIKTAFKYLMGGQNQKVVEYVQKAIDLYPKDPAVYKILYILQLQIMWDVEGAIETLNRAIEVAPDYPVAYNQLGYALMETGNFKKAEEAFNTYIKLAPDIANPYDSKGDFFMSTKQYEKAYDSYMKAYETDSSFTVSLKKAMKAKELMERSSRRSSFSYFPLHQR